MLNIRYILACCNNGQKKLGVERGPEILLDGIKNNFVSNKSGFSKRVYANINQRLFQNSKGYNILYHNTKELLSKNQCPIILGGDHSISSSTVPAFFDTFKERGKVLWLDAHADINTPKTSPSGNLHGMPVASILGLMDPVIKNKYTPSPEQIIYVGLREVDPEEKKVIEDLGITYYKPTDLEKDINSVLNEIKEKTEDKVLHVSLDVDAIDPIFITSTGTPVAGGLDLLEIQTIINSIELKNVKSLDFVEFNPFIDENRFHLNLYNSLKILHLFH